MFISRTFELLLCPYCAQIQESFRAPTQAKLLLMVGSTLLLFLLLATGVIILAFSYALKQKDTSTPTPNQRGSEPTGT